MWAASTSAPLYMLLPVPESSPFAPFFQLFFKKNCIYLKNFFAMPCGMGDLSFHTRDRTSAPCIGSMES